VNVFIDNAETEGAPLVQELNPNYNNLFGKVEKESRMGAFTTDFTLIINGSLHRAHGGYLVIPVMELFRNPYSWDNLKKAIEEKNYRSNLVQEKLYELIENDKVEGFYEVCKMMGFSGNQGVIIPKSNVRSLMLKEEVQESVKKR
jgi:predicted ATP-dependent protease